MIFLSSTLFDKEGRVQSYFIKSNLFYQNGREDLPCDFSCEP